MINHWWVTRPKRKLNSIPEELGVFASISLNQEWEGQRGKHLSFEEALEKAGLKRVGERRDQAGSGGRTHQAWLESLGLMFKQESTKQIKLTLAGEAIIDGKSPVEVLKGQVFKYQFPSAYSISRGVDISPRFRIRPFIFLLRLMLDSRIQYLTQAEIGKIVATEAENETDKCYEHVVKRIHEFRNAGDACLPSDFNEKYSSGRGRTAKTDIAERLMDVANTIENWIEYTQIAKRDENRKLYILPECIAEAQQIVNRAGNPIDRYSEHELFQRRYGVDPWHNKDTRNLSGTKMVTPQIIAEQQIKQAFLSECIKRPISKIDSALISTIAETTGRTQKETEELLIKFYPHGAVGAFMSEYFEMAFSGRDEAVSFEKATVEIFRNVFNFRAEHVGFVGLTPDVLVLSDVNGYIGIIDNKAYSKYSITNDHKNRMIHNYIETYRNGQEYPLAYFSYIAGGFGTNIDSQIKGIVDQTAVAGSAISISNFIGMIEKHSSQPYSHANIKDIFSLNRQIINADL